ncbi:hypothetical protein DH2020_030530 [Rehmannia glutinosa]|uniref:Uncharacterized protein n=1 Tax=Rehmannia glutinosa TaxID=99300 RepID=A0ABR0VN33_REHGL
MKIDSISLRPQFLLLVLIVTILHRVSSDSVSALCELSFEDKNKVYYYSLASPVRNFPHGVLSEDGLALSALRFDDIQPRSSSMCRLTAGPSRCGMGCSALVSNQIEGYPICTTLGQPSGSLIDVRDKKSPHTGIIVKMTNIGPKHNCSLSVSVICNSNGVQGPQTLETVGFCDYNTELKHPLGCAKIISSKGNGFGFESYASLEVTYWLVQFTGISSCIFVCNFMYQQRPPSGEVICFHSIVLLSKRHLSYGPASILLILSARVMINRGNAVVMMVDGGRCVVKIL